MTKTSHISSESGINCRRGIRSRSKRICFFGKPDENGNREIEGIMYDRLFALLIPIVRDLKTRIENIESTLN